MRRKRAALGISLLLLIGAGAFFLSCPARTSAMSEICLTEKKYHKILNNFLPAEEDILTVLCFQGEELSADRESATFYLPVDVDTEDWEEGSFTSGDEGVSIYLLDDPLADSKAEAVREGRVYRLLAIKGNTYREYSLVFTELPALSLLSYLELEEYVE